MDAFVLGSMIEADLVPPKPPPKLSPNTKIRQKYDGEGSGLLDPIKYIRNRNSSNIFTDNMPSEFVQPANFDAYEFMKDLPNGDFYTEIDTELPAKSIDFGSDGYTASTTIGHELLQLTAPDSKCGLVHVRGSFSDLPNAILARAQRRHGGKSTFGLKLLPSSGPEYRYKIDTFDSQGFINFRWPHVSYPLLDSGGPSSDGSCSAISFVKDGVVYQILRLEPGEPEVTIVTGGVQRAFYGVEDRSASRPPTASKQSPNKLRKVRIQIGGKIRIGCMCTSHPSPLPPRQSTYSVEHKGFDLSCFNEHYQKRLDINLFINGENTEMPISKTEEIDALEIEAMFETDVSLYPGKVTVVMATFALRDAADLSSRTEIPTGEALMDYLGVTESSLNATDRLWLDLFKPPIHTDTDFFDLCTGTSCLNQILGVLSVPMKLTRTLDEPAASSSIQGVQVNDGKFTPHRQTIEKSTEYHQNHARGPTTSEEHLPVVEGLLPPTFEWSQVTVPSSRYHQEETTTDLGSPDFEDLAPTHLKASRMPRSQDDLFLQDNSLRYHREETTTGLGEPLAEEYAPKWKASRLPLGQDDFLPEEDSFKTPRNPDHMDYPRVGIASLASILGNQHVDLQHTFWQIRFLVKAQDFLAIRSKATLSSVTPTQSLKNDIATDLSPSTAEISKFQHFDREPDTVIEPHNLEAIRTSYVHKIHDNIHLSLVWIVSARISGDSHPSPACEPFGSGFRKGCGPKEDQDQDRVYYPAIILWYVIRNCRSALPDEFLEYIHHEIDLSKYQSRRPLQTIDGEPNPPKLALLVWYSIGCLNRIYEYLVDTHCSPPPWATATFLETGRTESICQMKAEKAMTSTRKPQSNSYSSSDQEVERLALLGSELGLLVNESKRKDGSSCISRACRKILERKGTKILNPGKYLSAEQSSAQISTSPPWELSCINHHSRLRVMWNDGERDNEDLEPFRVDCRRFLTSSFTYIGSWDMSAAQIASKWWELDTSCMVASTSLDIRTKGLLLNGSITNQAPSAKSDPNFHGAQSSAPAKTKDGSRTTITINVQDENEVSKEAYQDTLIELIRKQLDNQEAILLAATKENNLGIDFEWTLCQPPNILHPEGWVASLDDTPEHFRSAQTKTIRLRTEIVQYLTSRKADELLDIGNTAGPIGKDFLESPDWTIENISSQFQPDELSYLSVYDFCQWGDARFSVPLVFGRAVAQFLPADELSEHGMGLQFVDEDDQDGFYGYSGEFLALVLWIAFFDGEFCGKRGPRELLDVGDLVWKKFTSLSWSDQAKLRDEGNVKKARKIAAENLLSVLNDSRVDKPIKHRVFFLQKCTPALVKAFIYMWHPPSIDTFDDHFRGSSRFSDTKADSWITSITLSFWCLRQEKHSNTYSMFDEGRDNAPFPPEKVALVKKVKSHWWQKHKSKNFKAQEIEEGSCSLIISSDNSGDWMASTIISPVLPEFMMAGCIREMTRVLAEFLHQPQTARCLTFLIFLGAMCDSLSKEYETILEELTKAIKLGREVLKKGLDWAHAEDAIERLKSMLWALEALRIFDDRLGESINQVRDAKDKMNKYISQGPGRRHEKLERACQSLVEEFDKRYERLVAVHVKIDQKITQISRYREGISAVSNLEDTHTALKQNDTIRILTYITIAYLPLGFVAAVFSMDIVTNANWGPKLFGGLVVAFLGSTFILARSLDIMISTWHRILYLFTKRIRLRSKQESEDVAVDEAEEKSNEYDENPVAFASAQPPSKWPMLRESPGKRNRLGLKYKGRHGSESF